LAKRGFLTGTKTATKTDTPVVVAISAAKSA
jgi:hypothetical protein